MMSVDEGSAAMAMLIDEQRRMRDTMERVNDTINSVMRQLERMDAESKHAVEQRTANSRRLDNHEKRFGTVEGRVDVLEDERHQRAGERRVLTWWGSNLGSVGAVILGIVLIAVLILKSSGKL
jgi:chromosome segregation ATPase